MASNTYCHNGYCDQVKEEKNNDKALAIGIYAAFVALISAIYWYAISHGIVIDPTYLS